jgi:opacity protein-like surface antigen
MTRLTCVVATVVCLVLPPAARAQSWEVGVLFGNTPSVQLDRNAPELDEVDIRGGYTWALQGSRFITSHLAAEVLWTHQSSALQLTSEAGSVDLFTMTINQVHGNVVYHLRPSARTRPFVFAGLGATFFDAVYQPGETKLSFGLGGGAEYFFSNMLGVRGQFRYKPTRLNDEDAGNFCDPFGFCQGTLPQVEFMAGAVVRF